VYKVFNGLVVLGLLYQPAAAARGGEPEPALAEFFEKEVRPLLAAHCFRCHGNAKPKGGLTLTSRADLLEGGDSGPAAVPGQPDKSLLIQAIRYQDMPQMPPPGKLGNRQIAILTRWVKLGLPWPLSQAPSVKTKGNTFQITPAQRKFWAFQPVQPVVAPAVKGRAWARSPVDHFIQAGLEAKGLIPTAPADRRTLIRRATFDLTGLPPTPENVDAFVRDRSPDAFARVVDRLLASPAYGERWGRHWLDVVRYADARDLIQLPPLSDFREAWRYRDWVVKAFNRDLPYTEFLRYQVAGDLLQPRDPSQINADALVATGMLALADFVPGDTDKELMIADYVNDQIDVVGRGFLGLTLACARCHDHKFDPVSTEDYYGLAGIFFSSRLVPEPVPGNTPLVRVPLMAPGQIAQVKARFAAGQQRRHELERLLAGAAERAYRTHLQEVVTKQTARYLVAACAYRNQTGGKARSSLREWAGKFQLQEAVLAGWVAYLDRLRSPTRAPHARPTDSARAAWFRKLHKAATGKLTGAALEQSARALEQAFVQVAGRRQAEAARRDLTLARTEVLRLRADDPLLAVDPQGRVTSWPDRSLVGHDAMPVARGKGPLQITTKINGHAHKVLRFTGSELLEARATVPKSGSLFIVFHTDRAGSAGQRLIGWEDAAVGKHGLGLMLTPAGGGLHAILRDNGQAGDVVHANPAAPDFEIVTLTWGARGTILHRNGTAAGSSQAIHALSSDPAIQCLRIGGPGSGDSPRFQGDLAEIRVYDVSLDDAARKKVEAELRQRWFKPAVRPQAPADPLETLYDELVSPRGPLWPQSGALEKLLPAAAQARLAGMRKELETLKTLKPPRIPEAVAVLDGGPKGTRHEGFHDAQVYLRGNPRSRGKTVPRSFPRVLAGDRQKPITHGSGRLQLADWLARPDHPLTARVMVNRIWQHHFGAGIVRTANNFGARGERPSHPELLDYLAGHFVRSGWSVKALHRLIMRSAVYQQSARASAQTLARDPDNRLFGRMNRRRLEAEAIRDSLLAVAGRLETTFGGPAFSDLAVPRRTLYLMTVRTGSNDAGFGALFDRADPSAIVDQRGASTVAPQALFFLNEPFVIAQALALAERMDRQAGGDNPARIRRLYATVFGRAPTAAELGIGLRMLRPAQTIDPWIRYCHLLLCTNEFLYVD
jgi:hypothetical protein